MRTARVVVIDEDPKEALLLLRALGQVGLGAVYIPGDNSDEFPQTPLSGIRVVFLDLKLIGLQEAKQYIPYTVQVLKQCVRCEPRTTGIVVWSKHSDEVETLTKTLADESIQPAYIKVIEDKTALTTGGKEFQELVAQLGEKLAEEPSAPPLTT